MSSRICRVFRFKQFSVRNEHPALKVGTDAVVLGAAMTLPAAGWPSLPSAGSSAPAALSPVLSGRVPPDQVLPGRISPAKVPSDQVLPGHVSPTQVPLDRPLRLLDIGTGTGVIALMAAQRISAALPLATENADACAAPLFHIDAIDIDDASIEEAAANFADSPWAASLAAIRVPLQSFAPSEPYDAIFSNPPFFEGSLKNPDAREAAARHTVSLSCRDICAFAADHLVKPLLRTVPDAAPGPSPAPSALPLGFPGAAAGPVDMQNPYGGTLSLIVPADCFTALERTAASFGLHLFRRIDIRTTAGKPVKRVIAEFANAQVFPSAIDSCHAPLGTMSSACQPSASRCPHPTRPLTGSLILQDGPRRTPEYSALTSEFYL